jgi:perosamine synthetase
MDFFHTHVAPNAVALATETLESGWLSEGARVKAFEQALSTDLGLVRAVAVNSGTAALHLALAVAGVTSGDEVILPAQTFVATGTSILMAGATPVFADIDAGTGNLSPAAVRECATERTKAIMPVHWGGYPCEMDEIAAVAEQVGAVVIEDAAHALGATYRGRAVGAISPLTIFSFQAIKHLTTGDGGALCCGTEEYESAARARRWFGIDRAKSQPSILGERLYDLEDLGFKYHMNDLAAAVGLGNLSDFPGRLAARRRTAARYRAELADVDGVRLLDIQPDREHAYWLFTLLVERREEFIRKLAAGDIPSSIVHRRIDGNSILGGLREGLEGQERFGASQISIPVHEGLTEDDVDRVIGAIRSGW